MKCSICNKEINSYTMINIEQPYYICDSCMKTLPKLYELMEEFSYRQLELEPIQEAYNTVKKELLHYLEDHKHV